MRDGSKRSHSVSAYVIKPECYHSARQIRRSIERIGLRIVLSQQVLLTEEFCTRIYDNSSDEFLNATLPFLIDKPSEIGVVYGKNCAKRLLRVAGTQTDPRMCRIGSIRRRFGVKDPVAAGDFLYRQNGFHRPKNKTEARRDVQIVREFLIRR